MPPEESTQLQSDLDVAICGPTHEDGWCKYCKAVQKLSTAVTEEREVCACLAESLIDLDENQDWQEGFNIACKILAHTIRARNRDVSVDKAVLSFKRLTPFDCGGTHRQAVTASGTVGHVDSCFSVGPRLRRCF